MDLPSLWFALVVLCWVLFFVLEGFDFGVGALAPLLGRGEEEQRDHERGAALGTIGPVWDGNEVWLVAAVGVTFAAFPDWYAALLSGLYLPMVLILLALAGRGVALEFRGKGGTGADGLRWRRRCDQVLAGCSLAVAALWGAVLGVLVDGLALAPDGEVLGTGAARTLAPLASTPALVGATVGVLAAVVQGATFLGLRTTGPVRVRARVAALVGTVATLVAAVALGVAGVVGVAAPDGASAVPVEAPGVPVGPAVALGAVLGLLALAAAIRWRREAVAFALTSVLVAGAVVAVFTAHLPVVLRSTLDPAASLTVAGAAASPQALQVITVAGVLVLPGVVAYQAFSYWVFRRRVASERAAA